MFAIYALSVTAVSQDECIAMFGEDRSALLMRYRAAALRALVAADFLTTKDLEVLQAFVLFLLADPESELTSTLSSAAIRLGQKMGLHRKEAPTHITFLETELRVRLWWQLYRLDCRVRSVQPQMLKPPQPSELGDFRLPLNVNDADMSPDMTKPPEERTGPTEMLCLLIKYETVNWLRTSVMAARIFENIGQKRRLSAELADEAVDELDAAYQNKFCQLLDESIPLHALAKAMAKLTVARMRFMVHHPSGHGNEAFITREESDSLWDAAVTSLDLIAVGTCSKMATHLLDHICGMSNMRIEAYIYVISELRQRCSGDRVSLAWRFVEDLYTEHPELVEDGGDAFFVALGDLTLEAWEARREELLREQGTREAEPPQFIQSLQQKRCGVGDGARMPVFAVTDAPGFETLGLTAENDMDWDYWNDLLRF
jgi:hypothetical protein